VVIVSHSLFLVEQSGLLSEVDGCLTPTRTGDIASRLGLSMPFALRVRLEEGTLRFHWGLYTGSGIQAKCYFRQFHRILLVT
jgi:hypothetical protein